jgi:hypothetical protein
VEDDIGYQDLTACHVPDCDESELQMYCFDNDGDGLGFGGEMEFCWDQGLEGWVNNCEDIDDACDCSENDVSCYDCSGTCGGDLVIDECDECGGDGIDEGPSSKHPQP